MQRLPAPRRLATLLLLGLSACGVPRPAARPVEPSDGSTLPNLGRAREALAQRVADERQHVAALQLRLEQVRADEQRLHLLAVQAEADFGIRQQDLAAVEAELSVLAGQHAAARAEVEALRAALESARLEQQLLAAELESARVELLALKDVSARDAALLASLPAAVRVAIAARLAELDAQPLRLGAGAPAAAHPEAASAAAPEAPPVPAAEVPPDDGAADDGAAEEPEERPDP